MNLQKWSSWILCTLLGLILVAGAVVAEAGDGESDTEARGGNLVGEVTNGDGGPVSDALVTLVGEQATRLATSDEEGRFLLEGLPTEIYKLEVEMPGYGSVTFEGVLVRSGRSTEVAVIFEPEAG